ncbi:hypothetical protein HDV63DRAFT_259691 [Trichoderma sp. SZMC 28014]
MPISFAFVFSFFAWSSSWGRFGSALVSSLFAIWWHRLTFQAISCLYFIPSLTLQRSLYMWAIPLGCSAIISLTLFRASLITSLTIFGADESPVYFQLKSKVFFFFHT